MTLRLYNTLSRSVEPFEPLDPELVRVYGCGPTIYDYAHIGNFRSFLVYDLLHRYLEWSGHRIRFVTNLTDVDDKTIDAALREGVTVEEFTPRYGEAFLADWDTLGFLRPDATPKATTHVGEMIELVERLEEAGLAYEAEGSVYYDISEFDGYGKLSRVDLEEMRQGERVASEEYAKDDPRDFVLWKGAKPQDRETGAVWDSPWGEGRPGWHLECSVMGLTELGDTLDIHLGGEDLVFPHHEDEIAQSEGATGKPFVRFWVHVKHLVVEGRKMSKSLGNQYTLRDLLERGFDPAAIRHQLMNAHYRSELNFTFDGLEASTRAVERLADFRRRLAALPGVEEERWIGSLDDEEPGEAVRRAGEAVEAAREEGETRVPEIAGEGLDAFRRAMDDDLNTAEALAALFVMVNETNGELDAAGDEVGTAEADAALGVLHAIDRVVGLLSLVRRDRREDPETRAWIEEMIEERRAARERKDFERADAIRDELAAEGIVLEDTPRGTRWKRVGSGEAAG